MLQYVCVVGLVEALCRSVLHGYVLQHLVEDAEAGVSHVTHRVLERPDHRVQHQLELGWWDREEGCTDKHDILTKLNLELYTCSQVIVLYTGVWY